MTDAWLEILDNLLSWLKIDLGISTTAYDSRLQEYLKSAYLAIEEEGVKTLDSENAKDTQLVVMYAAWLWRKRDNMQGMPRMIRYALNNRLFSEKMREETDG